MMFFFLFSCKSVEKKVADNTLCLGPQNASVGFVYLHGMDAVSPSQQELLNREKLERLSKKLGIRVAIPRANTVCPSNSKMLCWGWGFSSAELNSIKIQVLNAAQSCQLPEKFNLIGFSNGAYATNLLYKDCLLAGDSKIISIGASLLNPGSKFTDGELAKCGNLKILIGNKDQYNYDPNKALFNAIKSKNGNVEWIEFEGSHEISEDALLQVLK